MDPDGSCVRSARLSHFSMLSALQQTRRNRQRKCNSEVLIDRKSYYRIADSVLSFPLFQIVFLHFAALSFIVTELIASSSLTQPFTSWISKMRILCTGKCVLLFSIKEETNPFWALSLAYSEGKLKRANGFSSFF